MSGLNSSLSTALTGLQAAESTIAVAGNNVANSSTDGFKQSSVLFANQFLQTESIGSAPSGGLGGTNPRQIGLGVKVAAINPDFSQGTIQISSNPLDVAIQGDGFLIVQGAGGQQYTRNGQLQTNSLNQIVTSTGGLVLGQAADSSFNIDSNSLLLTPLTIPLGSQTVTQATKTATFSGVLTPKADVATAGVITSESLGDNTADYPNKFATNPANTFDSNDVQVGDAPNTAAANTSGATTGTGGTLPAGDYEYKVVWYTNKTPAGALDESAPSATITVPGVTSGDNVQLTNLPTDSSTNPLWDGRRIYRSDDGGATFNEIAQIADVNTTTSFTDDGSATPGAALNTVAGGLAQETYSYYVTFSNNAYESRPSALIGPFSITDASSRVFLDHLPQPSGGSSDNYNNINIYRNTGANSTDFELVQSVPVGTNTYIDEKSDAAITANNQQLDLLGKKAASTTKLVDVVIENSGSYSQPFVPGTLSFTGTRGGKALEAKTLTVDSNSTVAQLESFMKDAYGIDSDPSLGTAAGSVTLTAAGQIKFTSNQGIENAVGADQSSLSLTPTGSTTPIPIPLDFQTTTEAKGAGSTTDFVVFDKLGEPVNVRLSTDLESRTGITTTYRWIATSEDNQPGTGVSTLVGTGTVTFDANGNINSPTDATPTIAIDHPAANPLLVKLDLTHITGLAQTDSAGQNVSEVNLTQQDGFPPGTLTSFTITESGLIRGVFSNGAERPLGQIRMARFANNTGLTQSGNNQYAEGINSGSAVIGNPGDKGIGTLTSGAVELSNTDVGKNLIDLILASTQYRGGARVITTVQQLFDELLQLRAG